MSTSDHAFYEITIKTSYSLHLLQVWLKQTKQTASELSFGATHMRFITLRQNECFRPFSLRKKHKNFIFVSLVVNWVKENKKKGLAIEFCGHTHALCYASQK